VLEGLSPVPAIPEEIRGFWRKEAIRLSAPALHAVLASRDPKLAARLAPTDPQRLARALEVLDATGRSLLDWQGIAGTPLIHDAEALRLYVCPSREVLYARCDARLDSMAASGALDEVERLAALGLDPALPAMRAVGMRPFLAFLQGKIGWDAALAFAKTETRQYAKRQLTWARRNMIAWNSVIAQ
jgi:tRNA dimethylallyltransferase